MSFLFQQWGNFLTIIDKDLAVENEVIEVLEKSKALNEHYIEFCNSHEYPDIFVRYQVLFDVLKKTVHV